MRVSRPSNLIKAVLTSLAAKPKPERSLNAAVVHYRHNRCLLQIFSVFLLGLKDFRANYPLKKTHPKCIIIV
jgi:hypothetical protein